MFVSEKVKHEENVIDVYYIVKPIIYFAKFCGLWPHTVKRSSPGVGTASLLWYFFVFATYLYIFYLNIDNDFWRTFAAMTNSKIQSYGSWAQVLSGLSIGMISLFIAMCTFRKQWTFFEMLKSADDVLSKDFAVITPKKFYRKISLLGTVFVNVFLSIVVIMTYQLFTRVLGVPSFVVSFSYYLSNMPYYCVIMIFYFSTTTITRRFFYVNNILRQLVPQDIPKNVFELSSRTETNDLHVPTIALNEIYSIYGSHLKKNLPMSPPNKGYKNEDSIKREIRKLTMKLENQQDSFWRRFKCRNIIDIEEYKLAKICDVDQVIEYLTKLLDVHDLLLDCINLQNEILSFQILMIIAQIFVFEVFALFSLYRTMYNADNSGSNLFALTNAFWLFIYNLTLYIIISVSTECVNEGKLTGTYCHKVINKIPPSADPRIIEKLSIMSHQLTMRTPNITCGLFSFDWELMFSIISATSIYLVFLMQFDVAGNANKIGTSNLTATALTA